MTEPIKNTYESIQEKATGPGAEEWRRLDGARDDLSKLYRDLAEDPRYAPEYKAEYKAEQAWRKYEEVKAAVEELAPEARRKMLDFAEALERMAVPTPEGEALVIKDTNKLLLTAHERSRIEGLLSRAKEAGGPTGFAQKPRDILSREYGRGLKEGGPSGGATVRAVVGVSRDWGIDIDPVVDEHRKPYHRESLETAQSRRMRAGMVAKSVPEPPFPRPGSGQRRSRQGSGALFVPREGGKILPARRRPSWK